MDKFCDFFTFRPPGLITIDLRSYRQLLSFPFSLINSEKVCVLYMCMYVCIYNMCM